MKHQHDTASKNSLMQLRVASPAPDNGRTKHVSLLQTRLVTADTSRYCRQGFHKWERINAMMLRGNLLFPYVRSSYFTKIKDLHMNMINHICADKYNSMILRIFHRVMVEIIVSRNVVRQSRGRMPQPLCTFVGVLHVNIIYIYIIGINIYYVTLHTSGEDGMNASLMQCHAWKMWSSCTVMSSQHKRKGTLSE